MEYESMTLLKKENKKAELCVLLICIAILVPLIILSFYNRPSADDFNYSIHTHAAVQNGGNLFDIIDAAHWTNKYFYEHWQGLYTSAFILALQPGIFGESYYVLSALIVMTVMYLTILASVAILNRHFVLRSFLFTATASLFILTFLVTFMPSTHEGVYWFNGAMNYTPWALTNFLNLCLLLEAGSARTKKRKIVFIILSALLSFITSGANHVTSALNIGFLFLASVYALRRKKWYPLIPLLVALAGFALMYVAPGTAVRQQDYTEIAALPKAFSIVEKIGFLNKFAPLRYLSVGAILIFPIVYQTLRMFFYWVSIPGILVLLFSSPLVIAICIRNKERFPKKFPFMSILWSFLAIFGTFAVPYFSMGWFGAGRLRNVIFITMILLSFYLYIRIWGWLIVNDRVRFDRFDRFERFLPLLRHNAVKWGCRIVLPLCLCFLFIAPIQKRPSSVKTAIEDLFDGSARQYCEQMDARIELYNDDTLTEVVVEPLTATSSLLFSSDITSDPTYWKNGSISQYYGKKIYLRPTEGGKESADS